MSVGNSTVRQRKVVLSEGNFQVSSKNVEALSAKKRNNNATQSAIKWGLKEKKGEI